LGPVDDRAQEMAARAATALANAGHRAADRDDHHAAAGFFRRALELTPEDVPGRTELTYELAQQMYETSDFVATRELLASLIDEGRARDRIHLERAKRAGKLPEIRIAVQGVTGRLYYGSTPASEALEEIEQLLPLVASSPAATAEALRQQPGLYAMVGRFDEA